MANYHLDEEYYGRLSVRYLATVRRYLNDSALNSRYRFSTILWCNLRSEFSHLRRGGCTQQLCLDETGEIAVHDDLSAVEIDAFWKQAEQTLTRRQMEVLRLRCEGRSYAEIAQQCGISSKAVACRLARLRPKVERMIGH